MSQKTPSLLTSTITLVVICFVSAAWHQIRMRVTPKTLRTALEVLCGLVIVLTVAGRLLSGVHWFTDILGGVLLGFSIVFVYLAAVNAVSAEN